MEAPISSEVPGNFLSARRQATLKVRCPPGWAASQRLATSRAASSMAPRSAGTRSAWLAETTPKTRVHAASARAGSSSGPARIRPQMSWTGQGASPRKAACKLSLRNRSKNLRLPPFKLNSP